MMDTAAVAECRYRAEEKQPTVCCVMLVDGREAMVRRAVASFAAQSISAQLLIMDSGAQPLYTNKQAEGFHPALHYDRCLPGTIGHLRNVANARAIQHIGADLIAHWDSDDYSHPRRLEEQVALLQASGKQCVGYRELLFWDTRVAQIEVDPTRPGPEGHDCLGTVRSVGEAWIYRNHQANYATGASFLYRRELWEQQPFDDAPHEDRRWWLTPLVSRNCIGVTGIRGGGSATLIESTVDDKPRMICQLHGSNSEAYDRGVMLRNPDVWRRAEHWDKYCERTMKL